MELTSAMPTAAAGSRPIGTWDLLDRSQEQAAGGRERGLRRERAADLYDGGAAEEAQSRVASAGGSDGKDWTHWIDHKMSRMRGRVGPGWTPFFDHAPCTIL